MGSLCIGIRWPSEQRAPLPFPEPQEDGYKIANNWVAKNLGLSQLICPEWWVLPIIDFTIVKLSGFLSDAVFPVRNLQLWSLNKIMRITCVTQYNQSNFTTLLGFILLTKSRWQETTGEDINTESSKYQWSDVTTDRMARIFKNRAVHLTRNQLHA